MTIKFLCICDWGQVRSVAMAQFIHELNVDIEGGKKEGNYIWKYDSVEYEAIPVGEKVSSPETMQILKEWADYIIDVREYIPEDPWRNSRHPELLKKVEEVWQQFVEKHPLE